LGWRTVVTVHDLAFLRYPESHSPESRAYYAALGRSVRQATRVICISEATKRDLLAATDIGEEKVRVVHEAPDPRFAASAGTGHPPPDASAAGRPYFVCVGTIQPRKNLSLVFQALARLAPADRPELRVVGAPGWGGAEIATLPARLGIAGDVRFLGRRSTAEVVALYGGALALIYPSLLEGFGLPVLEAMAAGAPVVASDRSSIPEVAGDAALLFDAQDATALATLLDRVASSPRLREDLRARGRVRATHFTWQRAARATLEVFDEALKA
jgi:glycosyltransferase involved in cell wall biosynthesis